MVNECIINNNNDEEDDDDDDNNNNNNNNNNNKTFAHCLFLFSHCIVSRLSDHN